MLKKITAFVLVATCLLNNAYIAAEKQQDKYAEWCQNLELTQEQAQIFHRILMIAKR